MKRMICMLLCAVLLLSGCTRKQYRTPGTFYYHRSETSYSGTDGVCAPEVRELHGIDSDLDAVLELYCAGPISADLNNPLPPDAQVLSWELSEGVLTLNFSESLSRLSGIELTVAAACLARTFLELTGAQTLVLTADGALLGGETALRMTAGELELRDSSLDQQRRDYTVYYATLDRKYLVGHQVSLDPVGAKALPEQLLEQLLTPPTGEELLCPLPIGTRILSVSVSGGVCTVDLSGEFESRRFRSLTAQCLSLLSVVNTLTELEDIDRVEFTVEGSLLIRYGSMFIDKPLVRDERCIGPARTGLGEEDLLLYLVHGDERLLVPIPVRLRTSTAVPMPEQLLRSLLLDPGTNGFRSCIPSGTRLNSITITDGTCFVDLSAEYLNTPAELPYSGRVIAASLCQLEEIERVQILVDGAVPEEYDSSWFGILLPNSGWFL